MAGSAGARRVAARRRGAAARVGPALEDVLAAARLAGARRVVVRFVVDDARLAALRLAVPAAFLAPLAARRVVVAARRLVVVALAALPSAICRACFVRPSMRLSTLFTSARVLARLTWVCSCLIAARAVLSASFRLRSSWRRRSGGTRLSASRRALRPALTARPTRPERLVVRFLFPIHDLHQYAFAERLTHRSRMGRARDYSPRETPYQEVRKPQAVRHPNEPIHHARRNR